MDQHEFSMGNLFVQTEVVGLGKTAHEPSAEGSLAIQTPFRVTEGNRPTSIIPMNRLDPGVLRSLITLVEHSVFTQGAIWVIDSFDQSGVDLGKVLASRIVSERDREVEPNPGHNTSTSGLFLRHRRRRG